MRYFKQTKTKNMRTPKSSHIVRVPNAKNPNHIVSKPIFRRKTVDVDGLPRIKTITYEHKPLTKPNVIHVGVFRNWIYYFGYTYRPLVNVIGEARFTGLKDEDRKEVEKQELIILEEEKLVSKMTKDSDEIEMDLTRIKDAKKREEINDKSREIRIKILTSNKKINKIRTAINKIKKANDDVILKNIYNNAPRGHYVTTKGIVRDIDVPKDRLMYIDEIFFAYEVIDEPINLEIFEKNITKYNYENTFYHLHGELGKEVFNKTKLDANHELRDKVVHIKSIKEDKHIVPSLFGKVPVRLRKYQGDSYYKYIYDPNFFNPEIPYMFKITHSHVLLKPDTALDRDGYYNLFLMDYKEKSFNESSKEPDSLYEQEDEDDFVKMEFAPPHEYVGAVDNAIQICKIGIKNPPAWLYRLIEGVSKYDSREFLMCRAEEFTDQWFLLLMEHFDSFDYDISKEHSPFIGSPGLYLLTGHTNFRVFRPRWLTLMINDFILGHENSEVEEVDLGWLEEGLIPFTKQRSPKGFIDERKISIPVSTPYGNCLLQENINFPPHIIWATMKDKLTKATFNVGKLSKHHRIYTSTTLQTLEYKIRWHSLFNNLVTPFSNLSNYNDGLVRGMTAQTHPKNMKNKLRSPTQEAFISNYIESNILVNNKVDITKGTHQLNSEYYLGRTSSIDFNGVPFNIETLKGENILDTKYGLVFKTSLQPNCDEVQDINELGKPYTFDEDSTANDLLSIKRGSNLISHNVSNYSKSKGNPLKSNDGELSQIELDNAKYIKNA